MMVRAHDDVLPSETFDQLVSAMWTYIIKGSDFAVGAAHDKYILIQDTKGLQKHQVLRVHLHGKHTARP